ncbi:MAG: carbohydrate ABC transporter permease [Armatimonadota bacterium]|nr:carbohydrate ABC transporter permease [Armatimonadota bacterium]
MSSIKPKSDPAAGVRSNGLKWPFRWKTLSFLVLLFYTALALAPLYLMVVSSLIPLGSSFDMTDLRLVPTHPSLDNLVKFNERVGGNLLRWFFNSLLVSTVPVVTGLIFSLLAGYAMTKMQFPGRQFLFWTIIATMTIPYFVILIPMYEMVWKFQWVDTYAALLVPGIAGIGGVFLSRQFVQTLPSSLLESARMDGCGEFGIFRHVVLPLCKPLIAVLAIMGFVGAWGDYFWPYLVINSQKLYTVQMGIVSLIGVDKQFTGDLDYGEIMAASLAASIPVFLVFLAAQKQFVKGLTMGAVKG